MPVRGATQRRGERSRELILDVAEELMGSRGYSGTSMSVICKATGLPATSIYWHFGSKEGLLAAVMERGARRWFATLPDWAEVDDPKQVARAGARALTTRPAFLRLFYLLSLDSRDDVAAAALVRQVRATAFDHFRRAIERVLLLEHPPTLARAAADELSTFAVALSDGCFFALQLEPERTDAERMFTDLITAVRALAPAAVERAGSVGHANHAGHANANHTEQPEEPA